MAEDRDEAAPSLEPPSLFGRRKKKAARSAPAAGPTPTPTPAPPLAPPLAEPLTPAEPVHAESPAEFPTPGEIVAPGEATAPAATADSVVLADAVGSAVTEAFVEPEPEPVVAREPVLEPDERPTTMLGDMGAPPPAPVVGPSEVQAAVTTGAPPSREPAPPRDPWLRGRPAAVLTGLLVGALIVAATAGSLRLCTSIKGTSSCGGPGLFLLVAILIAAGLVGAALLRAAAVPQPGSTSFLAVGLLSVVTLLFLVGSIFSWWMVIVIPLVSVVTFLLSHWVTTTYIEPENEASERQRQADLHDVR
jgi:hypothetical protein